MTDSVQTTSDAAAAPDSGSEPIVREWVHLIIPVPGVWTIDPGHSILAFDCRHMMLTRLRGWFTSFSGDFHIAENPEDSWVEVTIDADSLQMPNPAAMGAVKGEHYLQAEKFSTLHFRSTRVTHVEASLWQVAGDLTIKDCTREVILDAGFEGVLPSPPMFGGRAKMAFAAQTEFDRRDFGLDANIPLPGGGWLVGNRVGLSLDVEANLA
jgi:polyisoprenoid-binding protein YceI